jgi:predicted Zn-dependent protease
LKEAVRSLAEIVAIDPKDFIAWAKLGSLHFELKAFPQADAAFRRSLELKVEYLPVWINVGKLRMAQKQFDAAIEIFKHAASLEPASAWTHQLLGEAYLQARKGALGAEALNKAIEIDPIGMAACHLQLAHLYELAGAKARAAREYRLFLQKVPDHPDKKRFEKYIKENGN